MSEKSIIALISIALLVYWIGSIFFIVLAVLAVFGLGVLIFQMINKHRDKKSKSNLFAKKIYVNINNVFNAKVSEGTTILDLAFLYDTEIGIHCNGGYVNRYRKSLSYALHNNDVVSFITDKNIYPKKEWLDYVTTELAKKSIEDYLRKKNDINEIEQKNIQSTVEIDSEVNIKESNQGKYKLEVKQEPELKKELLSNTIEVFAPNKMRIQLTKGVSVLDFAFFIHTDLGLHCIGANVNGVFQYRNYILKNGDNIEILTDDKQYPSRKWLKCATTKKAIKNIENYLSKKSCLNKNKENQKVIESNNDIYTWRKNVYWEIYHSSAKKEIDVILKNKDYAKGIIIIEDTIKKMESEGLPCRYWERMLEVMKKKEYDKEKADGITNILYMLQGNAKDKVDGVANILYMLREYLLNRETMCSTSVKDKNVEKMNVLSDIQIDGTDKPEEKIYITNTDVKKQNGSEYITIFIKRQYMDLAIQIPIGVTVLDFISYVSHVIGVKGLSTNVNGNKQTDNYVLQERDTVNVLNIETEEMIDWYSVIAKSKDKGKSGKDKYKAKRINIVAMSDNNKQEPVASKVLVMTDCNKSKQSSEQIIQNEIYEHDLKEVPKQKNKNKDKQISQVRELKIQKSNENEQFFKSYIENFEKRNNVELVQGVDIIYFKMLTNELKKLGKKTNAGFVLNSTKVYNIVRTIKLKYGLKWEKTSINKTNADIDKSERQALVSKSQQIENNYFFKSYIEKFEQRNGIELTTGIDSVYYQKLADELNSLGRLTNTGLEWNKSRVYSMVRTIKLKYGLNWYGGAISEQNGNVISKRDGVVEIDKQKLESIKKETLEAQTILSNIFVEEDNDENNSQDIKEDNPIMDILKSLLNKEQWQYSEVEELCKKYNVMMGFVLERINDYSFDMVGDSVVEDDGECINIIMEYKDSLGL